MIYWSINTLSVIYVVISQHFNTEPKYLARYVDSTRSTNNDVGAFADPSDCGKSKLVHVLESNSAICENVSQWSSMGRVFAVALFLVVESLHGHHVPVMEHE